MTVYVLKWSDDWVVIEDCNPEFLQSIHRTIKGAEKEAARMRRITRLPINRRSGKVTTRYSIHKHVVLD
jgi:hypothetical protein